MGRRSASGILRRARGRKILACSESGVSGGVNVARQQQQRAWCAAHRRCTLVWYVEFRLRDPLCPKKRRNPEEITTTKSYGCTFSESPAPYMVGCSASGLDSSTIYGWRGSPSGTKVGNARGCYAYRPAVGRAGLREMFGSCARGCDGAGLYGHDPTHTRAMERSESLGERSCYLAETVSEYEHYDCNACTGAKL